MTTSTIRIVTQEASFYGTLEDTITFEDHEMNLAHEKFDSLVKSNDFWGETDITLYKGNNVIRTIRI